MLEQLTRLVQGCDDDSPSTHMFSQASIHTSDGMYHSPYMYHKSSTYQEHAGVSAVNPRHGVSRPAAFRFLDLPTEIRHMVYGYCLQAKGTLRGDSELSCISHDFTKAIQEPIRLFDGTQIFRVCRLIFEEALRVFYSSNRFHFSTYGHMNQWPWSFNKYFSMLRHVQLEYIENTDWTGRYTYADINNAQLVEALTDSCPNLRTFVFYILTFPCYGPWTTDFFGYIHTVVSLDLTIHALSMLRRNVKTLHVVAYGCENAQQTLRSRIAEESEWREQICEDWPRVSMLRSYHERLLTRRDVLPMEQIREWSTNRPAYMD